MSHCAQVTKASRIGFVGVGRMGANMARCVNDAGFVLGGIFDINTAAAKDLSTELNATHCSTLADVTANSDVVITVVTNDAAMESIFFDASDNLLSQASGKLFLNCATVTPDVHRKVRQACDAANAFVLECPMASSIPQARDGKLYMMLGGEPAVFDAAKTLIETLTVTNKYIGNTGKAAEMKALVNMVMNINTAALAEGLGLAHELGLDLDLVREVFSQTGANSRVLETDGYDMQLRGHEPYFSSEHAAKDSGIALKLGREQGLPMVLAEATKNQYDLLCEFGLGGTDKSGISEICFKDRLPEGFWDKVNQPAPV